MTESNVLKSSLHLITVQAVSWTHKLRNCSQSTDIVQGNFGVTVFYYPPRDVFALNTGKYRPGCIFFIFQQYFGKYVTYKYFLYII